MPNAPGPPPAARPSPGPAAAAEADRTDRPGATLVRALGMRDAASLTIGSMVGTGIFLTAGDVSRAVGSAGASLAVWAVGGLLTLAGALTYGELGAMQPRAGGIYNYLRTAYGPLWGFLYGWTCLLVIMSGGIAAIAIGFGEYLGAFVPAFDGGRIWWALGAWVVRGPQVAAVLAIASLTALNHVGLRAASSGQNLFTLLKVAAIALLVGAGLVLAAPPGSALAPAAPGAAAWAPLPAFLTAMIAALWTYDGWYAVTLSAGEMRDPVRDLPRGITLGVCAVAVLYLLLDIVYLRALPLERLSHSTRAAEAAAQALLGGEAARAVSAAVALSAFGCLAATILYSSRIYQPMAEDGVFFRSVAEIHPRFRTPVRSLWLQSGWAIALALTGGYTQLFTYVTFGGVLFHVMAGGALFVLRRREPHRPRPWRAWGYPVVPAAFIASMALLTLNTLLAAPRESLLGLLVIGSGLPAYAAWARRPGGSVREERAQPRSM